MSPPFSKLRFFPRRVILRFAALALLSCGSLLRADNAISWSNITLPAVGFAGSNISFDATVANTGTTTWDSSYYLQLADAAGNHLYLPSIAGIPPSGTVPPGTLPGAVITVTFYLTLPSVPGTYTYGLSAVQHNVTYFGPPQTRTVVVSNLPPPALNPPDGQSVVWLSKYGFLNIGAPTIDTNWGGANVDSANVPIAHYRLRAKFPYPMPGDWHAANDPENKGKELDNLPPLGTYSPVSLYWVKYYPNTYDIVEIGPFTSRTVTIADAAVALSSYWFHETMRPTVTINQTLSKNYRLVVRRVGGVSNADLAVALNNSTRFLDYLPGPGEYTVEIFWEKYDDSGAVTDTQPHPHTFKTITITAGAIPVLSAAGGIWGDELYDEDGHQYGTNYSSDSFALYVPMEGELRLSTGGENTALRVKYVREGGNAWSDLNSTPGLGLNATISVLPRIYYLSVDGDATGSYQISADLTPPPPPVVTTTSLPPAMVGVPYGPVQITTTPPATVYYAALPPGLTISTRDGVISGIPTQATPAGTVDNAIVYTANGGGQGLSKKFTLTVAKGTPTLTVKNETVDNQLYLPITQAMIPAKAIAPAVGMPEPPGIIQYRAYRVIVPQIIHDPLTPATFGDGLRQVDRQLSVTATYVEDDNYLRTTQTVIFENRDTLPPVFPALGAGLTPLLLAPTSVSFRWNAATDASAGVLYDLSVDGGASVYAGAGGLTTPETVLKNLTASTAYQVVLRARDTLGNPPGLWSAPLTVTTPAAPPTASTGSTWRDLNGDGLADEIIANEVTPNSATRFNYFALPEADREVSFTEWQEIFIYVPGFSYVSTNRNYLDIADPTGPRILVYDQFIPVGIETVTTRLFAQVMPVFQFVAEPGYEYSVNRELTRSDGAKLYPRIFNPTLWEILGSVATVHEWSPGGPWLDDSYDAFPHVLVRYSKPMAALKMPIPGVGTVDVGVLNGSGSLTAPGLGTITVGSGAASGTITVGGITVGAGSGGTGQMTIPGVGTINVNATGVSVTLTGGGTNAVSSATTTLPGGTTVSAEAGGAAKITRPDGSVIRVAADGSATVTVPNGSVIGTTPGGGITVKFPSGAVLTRSADGTNLGLILPPGTNSVPIQATDPDGIVQGRNAGTIWVKGSETDPEIADGSTPGSANVGATAADGPRRVGVKQTPNGVIIWITVSVAQPIIRATAPMIGVAGDEVPSNRVTGGEKHFVSPKSTAVGSEYVIFEAGNLSAAEFDNSYMWDPEFGQVVAGASNQCQVSRATPGVYQLRIKAKNSGAVVARMNVWVVWAEKVEGGLLNPTEPWPVGTLRGQPPGSDPSTAFSFRFETSRISTTHLPHGWLFRFKILPVELFDPAADRPNLAGEKSTPTPGANNTDLVQPFLGSTDKATNKWDVTRQYSLKVLNPNGILRENLPPPIAWHSSQPAAPGDPISAVVLAVPFPGDPAEANDDPATDDEDTNPYLAKPFNAQGGLGHAIGQVTSVDTPEMGMLHISAVGRSGAKFSAEVNFREFVRLEIWNGSRTSGRFWFKVSDYLEWHFAMRCKVAGDKWVDDGSSTDFGPVPASSP